MKTKTPDEYMNLKSALDICADNECYGDQFDCPFHENFPCTMIMAKQARAYIDELEERIRMMMIQMQGECGCCAYQDRPIHKSPCSECLCGENRPMWAYEGLPEVNHDLDKGDEKP